MFKRFESENYVENPAEHDLAGESNKRDARSQQEGTITQKLVLCGEMPAPVSLKDRAKSRIIAIVVAGHGQLDRS